MYLDAELLFSKAQKITQSCASEKSLDLGGQEANGLPVFPLVQVTEAFEGLTSLTVHIQSGEPKKKGDTLSDMLEEDWQTIMSSKKLLAEDLKKPFTLSFGSLPSGAGRFLRIRYGVEGTAGKGAVTAGLVLNTQG